MKSKWIFCLGQPSTENMLELAKFCGTSGLFLPVPERISRSGSSWLEFADTMRLLRELNCAQGDNVLVILIPNFMRVNLGWLSFWIRRSFDEAVLVWDCVELSFAQLLRDGLEQLEEVPLVLPEVPILTTSRLCLTSPSADQSRSYFSEIVGTKIFDDLIWEGPLFAEELINYGFEGRRSLLRSNTTADSFAIIEKSSDKMIGGMSWRPRAHDPGLGDIGYALAPAFHGQGYATEAVGRLLEYVVSVRGGRRIEADVFVGNVASRRVLEKNGFELYGTKSSCVVKRGKVFDEWAFCKIY